MESERTNQMPCDLPDTYGNRAVSQESTSTHNVQWPLKLMRISALSPFFHRAHLLLAADCTAFSYTRFDAAFGAGKTLVIGCPDAWSIW